ncbi:hypothetical protein OG760_12025 [Streptomyces sp. NBC_00963]|uniref:hypothetical protein n=1 Tax=unclassified Streptomyces TaxID=2593676 RepID=UPI002258E2CF|nr:hypothetical protein [Streptomyces sp. NBC_01306]MCX4726365.1 hypothetical protein [Streptomyces sp. NBC_01306]WSX42372.1 hypothetical protein OG760_12025 [Streptomyces sp. NBC_00963]
MKAFPYKRLPGAVSLRVTAVGLRGPGENREPLDTKAFSVVEQVVALGMTERDDWESARLKLSATVPARATESDGYWSDVSVVAVLIDKVTNTRTVVRLKQDTEGGREWGGHLELWRADHLDRATLSVSVVATVDGVPGRVIATSEKDWIVDLTARAPLRDRELDVVEIGFREGPEWLRPFRDVPWIVDTSGELPAVHLNTDFEGITDLVGANGSSVESLVRDLLLAQMCTDVWTAVFHTAIGDLEMEEDGTPLFPHDWRGEVLREMLPDVVPGRSPEDALRDVHRRRTGTSGWTDLQPRIHFAATRRAEVPKALSTTIRGLDRLHRESDV